MMPEESQDKEETAGKTAYGTDQVRHESYIQEGDPKVKGRPLILAQ
jgi:hypothetical protein